MSKPDPFERWRSKSEPIDPEPSPPEDTDFIEEPSGDGRSARHQVYGLEVEDSAKDLWFFPYGALLPSKLGPVNGGKYTFRIAGDECNYDLEIEGPVSAARYAIDKLCSGKRELLRANDASISAITVRVVPFKKPAKD